MDEHFKVAISKAQNTGDFYSFQALLLVTRDNEKVDTIRIRLTNSALAVLGGHFPNGFAEAQLENRMLRWGLGRLAGLLSRPGGADELFPESELVDWMISSDDLDHTLLDSSILVKQCSYQRIEGRDLYCAAAGPGDGNGTSGIRQIAITSRPMCDDCGIPDD